MTLLGSEEVGGVEPMSIMLRRDQHRNFGGMKPLFVGAMVLIFGSAAAMADPALQIYIEGAVYDDVDESWILAPDSPLDTFRLWTIGNVDGSGGVGTISNVRLSLAYDSGLTPTFTLTGSDAGGFGGWVDPTVAPNATFIQTVTDGSRPLLSDGTSLGLLAPHGIYGAGTDWQEFALGDFDEVTSSTADVIDTFPENPGDLGGHINVYEVSVTGLDGGVLHIDLYDSIEGGHAKFAPFSHDAAIVPAPGAALLAMIGFGFAGVARRRLR